MTDAEGLLTRTCTRCGHEWYARQPEPPRVCPRCKSPYWSTPRRVPTVGRITDQRDAARKALGEGA